MLEARYFGAFVPWFVRIRLLPEADGDPVPAYRRNPRVNPAAPASADEERSLEGRTVLTLNTLERWMGRPVFDAALTEFVQRSGTGRPTIADFARVASASTGLDPSPLLTVSSPDRRYSSTPWRGSPASRVGPAGSTPRS